MIIITTIGSVTVDERMKELAMMWLVHKVLIHINQDEIEIAIEIEMCTGNIMSFDANRTTLVTKYHQTSIPLIVRVNCKLAEMLVARLHKQILLVITTLATIIKE